MASVCIIGAGLSGLTSIKSCLEEGLKPKCYETSSDVGGLWNYHISKHWTEGARLYTSMLTNFSKEMMSFSDFPMPKEFPMFLTWEHMHDYLQNYAKHFDLKEHVRFQHKVLKAEPIETGDSTRWSITVQDIVSGKIFNKTFDNMIVCTGPFTKRIIPQFKGTENFEGQIIHSAKFNSEDDFTGKRVVVVGASQSGCDLTCSISETAKQTYFSSREKTFLLQRLPGGLPFDMLNISRVKTIVRNLVPQCITNYMVKSIVNKAFDHETYGLNTKFGAFDHRTRFAVSDELPLRIATHKAVVVPEIERLEGKSVYLINGRVLKDIDVIYCATGYKPTFPFLPGHIMPGEASEMKMYKWIFPLTIKDPSSLAFIRCCSPGTGDSNLQTAEIQVRLAAAVMAGAVKLPLKNEMIKEYEKEHKFLCRTGTFIHKFHPQTYPVSIAKLLGVYPNFWKLLFTDPRLAIAAFFGPTVAPIFRISGRNNSPEMRKYILKTWDNTMTGFNVY